MEKTQKRASRQDVLNSVQDFLFTHFKVNSLEAVKAKMKAAAKYEYGCKSSDINIGRGVRIIYTNNDNCFASYIVRLQGVGMSSEYALDKASLTKAGKMRGCANHYLFN